jgi:hypothetical protein
MQVQVLRDDLFFDLWVDWRKMIYPNDPQQEQFTTGLNLNKRIIQSRAMDVSVPVQMVVSHKGGQINFRSQSPVETLFNSAFVLEVKLRSTGLVRETRFSGFYTYYKTLTKDLVQPFKDGSGAYVNASVSTRYGLDVMGSYWVGHKFISVEGGKIYPSVSVFNNAWQQPVMRLFILRFLYSVKISDGLYASARVEPFYDFSYRSFQYSYGVYFHFRDRFFLWKHKKS